MSTRLTTWSPFQSAEVQQICAHMTPGELASAGRRATLYGLWVAATFALPLSSVMNPRSETATLALGLILLHVACIPIWMRQQRPFIASTSWASEQGIKPEDLRLFSLRR